MKTSDVKWLEHAGIALASLILTAAGSAIVSPGARDLVANHPALATVVGLIVPVVAGAIAWLKTKLSSVDPKAGA